MERLGERGVTDQFIIHFWGVRGTMPTPHAANLRYGGHTSCVEMRCGDRRLLFDAGTGLYPLGEDETLRDMDLFLSHTHIDHISGFPFFSPAYREDAVIRMWAGHLKPEGRTLRDTLSCLMSPPIFPLTLDFLQADIHYNDFEAGEVIQPAHFENAGIEVQTLPLNHPDRATGYRVNFNGKSACYITDIEHLRDGLNEQLVAFIRNSDVLIYDSTFDDRDFDRFIGWGHSTWQEAVRLANAANIKHLVLFHHDPGRTDEELDMRFEELRAMRPADFVAREGLTISI